MIKIKIGGLFWWSFIIFNDHKHIRPFISFSQYFYNYIKERKSDSVLKNVRALADLTKNDSNFKTEFLF